MMGPILLVDDDNDSVLMYSAVLESRGYAVGIARDGEEAFHAADIAPSLVLLDLHLLHIRA